VPRNFGLPFRFGSKRGPSSSGPFGGFLGPAYDTVWAEFRAKGIREVLRDSGENNSPQMTVADPYIGILPTDRFETIAPDATVTIDRMNGRLWLLDQFVWHAGKSMRRIRTATSTGIMHWRVRC